jgi:Skp family chaperone for outer membrane proteins
MFIRNLFALVIILISASFGAAQAPATKIAIIDSNAFFDEKGGITKLVNAAKQLNEGFKPTQVELDTLNKRLQTLAVEIENLRKQPSPDQRALQTKADEGEQLQRNIKYKTEDAKEKYTRQQGLAIGPVMQAIGKGLQDYAKQKGYTLIFDMAKDQNGFLVAIGDQSADVTKDFVTFYNAKP